MHVCFPDGFSGALRELLGVEKKQRTRLARADAWKQWFADDWAGSRKRTFAYVRGEEQLPSASILQRDDGTLTGNIMDIDNMLLGAWIPTFRARDFEPAPSWDAFYVRYQQHIPRFQPYMAELIESSHIREGLNRMDGDTACGVDGWRLHELKSLPEELLQRLAILNLVEDTGRWPECLTKALVTMIPKGEGFHPLDLRPISVTPNIYRLWSSCRVQGALSWQEGL